MDEYRYRVNGCQSGSKKSYSHVKPTCANCQSRHQATFFKCSVRYKAEKEARKRKEEKKKETDELPFDEESPADKEPLANRDNKNEVPAHGPEEENLNLLIETDDWTASPTSLYSLDQNSEVLDSTNCWD